MPVSHCSRLAKLEVEAIIADIQGLISVSEMWQSERFLFIHKGCYKKVIPFYTLTMCITKPLDKKAPTLIQSSSRNVHYKDKASNHCEDLAKQIWFLSWVLIITLGTKNLTEECPFFLYFTHFNQTKQT